MINDVDKFSKIIKSTFNDGYRSGLLEIKRFIEWEPDSRTKEELLHYIESRIKGDENVRD